jgi:dTDP-4-dehydrorhamnose reductase
MSNDTVLVLGASGLVGRCLLRVLREQDRAVVGTCLSRQQDGLRRLDITDAGQISACFKELKPKSVFLSAALTHVEYCEEHPEEAERQNVFGPRLVAEQARRAGAKLVFYSTEYVFDGVNGPYDEMAQPNPLSSYGRTKLAAENAIRDSLEDPLIVRTTVVFGWDHGSKNFAMQIYERVQKGLEMTIPGDQIGTPTLAGYLADASVRLAQMGVAGVVNVVGKDIVPRSDFARALVKLYGGKPELVIPVSTASLHQKAARPLHGGLRTEKLQRLWGEEPPSLEQSLRRLELEWKSAP